jgi:hypothetical protein
LEVLKVLVAAGAETNTPDSKVRGGGGPKSACVFFWGS